MDPIQGYGVQGVGNGIVDDAPAIQSTFDRASPGDIIIFGAGRRYRLGSGVILNVPNVTLSAQGATLDSRTLDANALTLAAPHCSVFGMTFKGPDNSSGIAADTKGNSRGIYVEAEHCMVRDCRLEGYRAGGIVVVGDYATVQGNHLIRVRNYRVTGAGLGSIHLWGGNKCIIANNVITEVQNCGIGVSGSSEIIITGNYIEGSDVTVDPLAARGMGIVFMNGGNYCIISNNFIKRLPNEGIILSTGGNGPTCSGNIISSNQIIDTDYHAINLRAVGGTVDERHIARDNVISNNRIYAVNVPPGKFMSAGICFEADGAYDDCVHNQASDNIISGENGKLERGIRTLGAGSRVAYNTVKDNKISHATIVGIYHAGAFSDIGGNVLYGCRIGMEIVSGTQARIYDNNISASAVDSIRLRGTPARLEVSANMLDREVNVSEALGASYFVEPQRW